MAPKKLIMCNDLGNNVRMKWNTLCDISGTFGQENEWHLGDPSSYHYPDVLRDILYDNDDAVMGSLVTDGEKYDPHTGGREEMKDHMEVLDITEDTENWVSSSAWCDYDCNYNLW